LGGVPEAVNHHSAEFFPQVLWRGKYIFVYLDAFSAFGSSSVDGL
jgi:hypothetical protein